MNCREASYYCSKELDGGLTEAEEILLHSHLMGCPSCSLYREQIGFLTHIFEAYRKRQQVQSRSPLRKVCKNRPDMCLAPA